MWSVPNLKYKTTICHNWRDGIYCDKKQNCFFAHGEAELRTLQENQASIALRNASFVHCDALPNYKTIFCKFYAVGQCKLGQACTFAHQRYEKRIKPIRQQNDFEDSHADYQQSQLIGYLPQAYYFSEPTSWQFYQQQPYEVSQQVSQPSQTNTTDLKNSVETLAQSHAALNSSQDAQKSEDSPQTGNSPKANRE